MGFRAFSFLAFYGSYLIIILFWVCLQLSSFFSRFHDQSRICDFSEAYFLVRVLLFTTFQAFSKLRCLMLKLRFWTVALLSFFSLSSFFFFFIHPSPILSSPGKFKKALLCNKIFYIHVSDHSNIVVISICTFLSKKIKKLKKNQTSESSWLKFYDFEALGCGVSVFTFQFSFVLLFFRFCFVLIAERIEF